MEVITGPGVTVNAPGAVTDCPSAFVIVTSKGPVVEPDGNEVCTIEGAQVTDVVDPLPKQLKVEAPLVNVTVGYPKFVPVMVKVGYPPPGPWFGAMLVKVGGPI
ncbi:MAG: hypothetical protein WAK75_06420 [Methanoregula sp.]